MARKRLGEMLIEAGVLSEQGLRMALNEQKRWGGSLGVRLIDMKLVNENELVAVLARQLTMPTIDLDHLEIDPAVLDLVDGEMAHRHAIVPFQVQMKFLDVAMADPTNLGVLDELRIRTQLNIRPYLAGPKMIERAIGKHYARGFGRSHRPDVAISIDHMGDAVTIKEPEPGQAKRDEGMRPYPRQTRSPMLQTPATPVPTGHIGPPPIASRDAEIDALQERISALEALVARDEDVLRKVLGLLVEKQIATREEILERLR